MEVKTSGCYLLHFEQQVAYPKCHLYGDTNHYIGFSTHIANRVRSHMIGRGAMQTKQAVNSQVLMSLVRFWTVDRIYESRLVRYGATALCPLCQSEQQRLSEPRWISRDSYNLWIPFQNCYDNVDIYWKVSDYLDTVQNQ
jgi:hypothetical protein